MSEFEADVLVVGGGPAGLASAIAATRQGLRVIVADGSHPPVDKACGEGLMPDARQAAARIGIHIPDTCGYAFRGIRFLSKRRSVEADFPEGRGVGLRRTVLHELLVGAAERAGVEMRWDTPVTALDSIRARWVIGADGSGSRVRHWAGLDRYVHNSHRFAFRQHFAIAPWTGYMEMYWSNGCQLYVTPTNDSEVCVALISGDPHLRLQDALHRSFPAVAARLAGVPASSRERGAITAMLRLRSVASGRVALIGDASGSVDAITGEGICLTFRQALVLARAIASGDLAAYNTAHPRLLLRPHLMARLMLAMDGGPLIRESALGLLSCAPGNLSQASCSTCRRFPDSNYMKTSLLIFATALPLFAAEQSLVLTPENTKVEWTLTDPLHTVHGNFKLKRGNIRFDTSSGAAAGEVLVDVKSGESGSGARDSRMHASVLESAKYPEAVFTPDHVEGKLAPQGPSSLQLHGAFRIHGASHEVTMMVAAKAADGQLDTTITFDIPYVAWGMKDPSNFLLKVNKSVQMSIHTTAVPQP